MLLPLDPSMHIFRENGPFRIRRMHPGAMLAMPGDGGFGPLGLIDRATLSPGLTVAMHEHRNDEIISYLRQGVMIHRDSGGVTQEVRPDRLMVMNAGAGFSHEETVPGPDDVSMLQIFVRPSAADLPPGVQFAALDEAASEGRWRLLSGPAGSGAPTLVRQDIHLHDAALPAGESLRTPAHPGFDGWLYVFEGAVDIGGLRLSTGDAAAIVGEASLGITAASRSDLVFFLVNRNAPASRSGTLSGR